jgi:hypothetical protein
MIKYRGKTNIDINELEEMGLEHDGNWVFGTYLDGYIVNGVVEATSEYIALKNWCPVDRNTVGQYIGLKDKNDVEIYEWDIVKWFDSDGLTRFDVVKYCQKKAKFYICNKEYNICDYGELEKVGNIHENSK